MVAIPKCYLQVVRPNLGVQVMGNLIIKICAGTDKADAHYGKEFQLIHVPEFTVISFKQKPYPQMIIDHDEGGKMEVTGNVYVMNNDGKTITTFTPESTGDCCIEKLGNVDIREFDFYQDANHIFYVYSKTHDRMWTTQKRFSIDCDEITMSIDPLQDNYFSTLHRINELRDPETKVSFSDINQPVYVSGDFIYRPGLSLVGVYDNKLLDLTSFFVNDKWTTRQSGLEGHEIEHEIDFPSDYIPKIHGMVFKHANRTFMCYEDKTRTKDKFRFIRLKINR